MDPLYLRKLRIERQLNPQNTNNASKGAEESAKDAQKAASQNIQSEEPAQISKETQAQQTNLHSQSEQIMKDMRDEMLNPRQMKMNYLASMERSTYVKKVMNLPRTLPELLIQLQKPAHHNDIHNVIVNDIPTPGKPNPKEPPSNNPAGVLPDHQDGKPEVRPDGNRPHGNRPNNNHVRPGGNRPLNWDFNPHGKHDKVVPDFIDNKSQVIHRQIINNQQPLPPHIHHQHRRPEHKPHHEIHEPPPPTEAKKDIPPANIYVNQAMNEMNPTLTQMRQRLSDDAFELLFTGLINLHELSETMKHNGHDARSRLILAMANASKQGIDNSQIAATMKMVTESMAAEENNPSSILKNIIMLYLPWYPLQEGVGFNLSIDTMDGSSEFSSLLKVFIQTRNYGNVNGSLVLLTGNAVDMNIQCNDSFPQDDLLERMKDVTDNHSIRSNITVEERAQFANEMANQQAKVNLSSTYELNPFLLLMAHSFIKNTIIIDSGAAA